MPISREGSCGDGASRGRLGLAALPLAVWMLLAAPHSASAQAGLDTGPPAPDDAVVDILVTRTFLSADTSGTTNLPLPIEKVPQSITLIDAGLIDAAKIRSASELVPYVAGASDVGSEAAAYTFIKLRGFESTFYFSNYIDGLATADIKGQQEFTFLDRVEIVKGPSSVTYGPANAGGLVNYVTKAAPHEFHAEFAAEYDTFGSGRVQGEVGGPLTDSGAVRGLLNAFYDEGNTQIDNYTTRRFGVYGAVDYDITDDIHSFVHVGYNNLDYDAYDGLPFAPDGSQQIPRAYNPYNDKIDRAKDASVYASVHLDWEVTPDLTLTARGFFKHSDFTNRNAFFFSVTPANAALIGPGQDDGTSETGSVSLTGVYKLTPLGLDDSFVTAALTYVGQSSVDYTPTPSGLVTVNLLGPEAVAEAAVGSGLQFVPNPQAFSPTQARYPDVNRNFLAAGQAYIKPLDSLAFLFGVSSTTPYTQQLGFIGGVPQLDSDQTLHYPTHIDYKAAVTYEVLSGTELYFAYADAFEPQDSVDPNLHVLPPLLSKQYEFGAKSRMMDGRLLLTAAAFRIDQHNTAQYVGVSPINGAGVFLPIGAVRHQGFELEATGRLTEELQVKANYTYLDATVTNDIDPTIIGKRRVFIPPHTIGAFALQEWKEGPLKGAYLGMGFQFVSSQPTSYSGASKPYTNYEKLDILFGYRRDKWDYSVNIVNAFDRTYFQFPYDDPNYAYLQPTLNARFRVSREF